MANLKYMLIFLRNIYSSIHSMKRKAHCFLVFQCMRLKARKNVKMASIFTFENVLHMIDGMKEIIQIKKMVMTVLRLLV